MVFVEVAFTLERYWNDCYCIFEHITKCMIVPLLNDSEKTKSNEGAMRTV